MSKAPSFIRYPRFQIRRSILRLATAGLVRLLCKLEVRNLDKLPKDGPIILAGNHFHWADPALLIAISPRQFEFIAGHRRPNAPWIVKKLPDLWGIMPAFRGGYSRSTLQASLSVLEQDGPVALFPEGGAWAQVLRKPRGGVGFLATQSGHKIIPMAIEGAPGLLKSWRPKVSLTFGDPIGPFTLSGDKSKRRAEMYAAAHAIMRAIADMLPEEQRGIYAKDKALIAQAEIESEFPFEQEGMRGG